MRRLVAGMKVSLDGKTEGPEGMADWVDAWSEDYGYTPTIDACLLGGGMYPGYEAYWTGIRNAPGEPAWITGQPPTAGELAWSRFIPAVPHYVLSGSLSETAWPNTHFLRSLEEVAALKEGPGKDIYLVGGGKVTASLIEAGLVDELRLIVHPLIAGEGKALFGTAGARKSLELRDVRSLGDGRVMLAYAMA